MPDTLERKANERTSATAIDRSPWGREGVVLNSSRYEQALELAGLDYDVVKVPAYRERLHSAGDGYVESKTAFATVRADKDVELGIVGPQYEPLQNRDAFQVIEPWVDRGVLHIELGGVMRDGADAWLLGRFDLDLFGPVVQEVFADQVVPYILVANNHDGRRSARIAETPIRIACANMLDMLDREVKQGHGRMVVVRHTSKAAERMLEAAAELLGAIVDRYEMLGKEYQLLKETKLDSAEFERLLLDPIAPDPREDPLWRPTNASSEAALERTLARRLELRRLWTAGDGHTGDCSAWEAYNALVQAVDHSEILFPVRNERNQVAARRPPPQPEA
jgi:phage/plasmid-like protein (TIGR03299 family)